MKSQLLLDGIVNNSTAVICVKDMQGKYLMANTRFNDLFNESHLDIIGKTDFDFFPEYQARLLRANDRQVLMGRQVQQFEEKLRYKDRSVEAYRNQIRKKLHLNRKNITLNQYLVSTFISEA